MLNNSYCRFLNKSAEELLGTSFFSSLPDETRVKVEQAMQSFNPEHSVQTNDFKIALPNGRVIWQSWTHSAIFNSKGKLSEIQSVGRDISDAKITEEAIKIISEETAGVTGQLFCDSLVNAMCKILNVFNKTRKLPSV